MELEVHKLWAATSASEPKSGTGEPVAGVWNLTGLPGAVNGHERLRVGGLLLAGWADNKTPDWWTPVLRMSGQVNGTTPLPASASASRCESPLVVTKCAWCNSRSTVAVANVLGMIESNPEGCRLLVTAIERRS
jgi:hypothetical protein